jgi:hypothetical protein
MVGNQTLRYGNCASSGSADPGRFDETGRARLPRGICCPDAAVSIIHSLKLCRQLPPRQLRRA